MSKPTLGYWGLRGQAECIRYILRYTGIEWNDNQLELTMEQFNQYFGVDKPAMFERGFQLANLPYLEDGDVKLTQSVAICRYLARKHGLAPSSEAELQRCDMAEQEVMDYRTGYARLCYDPNFDEKKEEYLKNLEKKLTAFNRFLGDGPFILGNKICYVDFMMYEYLSQVKALAPDHFKDKDNINKALAAIEALPQLKAWFNSEEYKKPRYINSPNSKFPGLGL